MNTNDEIKLMLHLFRTFLFLLLYLHLVACFWFYVAKID